MPPPHLFQLCRFAATLLHWNWTHSNHQLSFASIPATLLHWNWTHSNESSTEFRKHVPGRDGSSNLQWWAYCSTRKGFHFPKASRQVYQGISPVNFQKQPHEYKSICSLYNTTWTCIWIRRTDEQKRRYLDRCLCTCYVHAHGNCICSPAVHL